MTRIPLESAEQIVRAHATIDFPWEKIIDELRALAVGEVVGCDLVPLSDVERMVTGYIEREQRNYAEANKRDDDIDRVRHATGTEVALSIRDSLSSLPSGGGEAGAVEQLIKVASIHYQVTKAEVAAARSELAHLRASRERMRKALERLREYWDNGESGRGPYWQAVEQARAALEETT